MTNLPVLKIDHQRIPRRMKKRYTRMIRFTYRRTEVPLSRLVQREEMLFPWDCRTHGVPVGLAGEREVLIGEKKAPCPHPECGYGPRVLEFIDRSTMPTATYAEVMADPSVLTRGFVTKRTATREKFCIDAVSQKGKPLRATGFAWVVA